MTSAVPNQVFVYQDSPNRVVVEEDAPTRIVVNTNFTGAFTRRYIHTQATASSMWTINHTLGGYPSVTVVDSASTMVVGEVLYVSTSQVQVSFTAPFSGFAYLT